MKYKIVIPSYKRYNTLVNKTLKMIEKYKINPEIVYIFLGNNEEKEKYLEVLPEQYKNRIVIGEVGIKNIRNYITKYFNKGEYIFCLDDDITNIFVKDYNNLKELESLEELIELGFSLCEDKDSKIFTVYPVQNAFFMKDSISRGLFYVMGACFGMINEPNLLVNVDNKEDYERSIQYFLDSKGGILRFNNICCGTRGYVGAGGLQSFDRGYNTILKSCEELIKLYPEYAKLNLGKKSGKPEIKLKNINYEEIIFFV